MVEVDMGGGLFLAIGELFGKPSSGCSLWGEH